MRIKKPSVDIKLSTAPNIVSVRKTLYLFSFVHMFQETLRLRLFFVKSLHSSNYYSSLLLIFIHCIYYEDCGCSLAALMWLMSFLITSAPTWSDSGKRSSQPLPTYYQLPPCMLPPPYLCNYSIRACGGSGPATQCPLFPKHEVLYLLYRACIRSIWK